MNKLKVMNEKGNPIKAEVICEDTDLMPMELNIRNETSICFMYFNTLLPAYSFRTFNIQLVPSSETSTILEKQEIKKVGVQYIPLPVKGGQSELRLNPFNYKFSYACNSGAKDCVDVKEFDVNVLYYKGKDSGMQSFTLDGKPTSLRGKLLRHYYFVGEIASQLTLEYEFLVLRLRVSDPEYIELETFIKRLPKNEFQHAQFILGIVVP